MKPYYEIQGFKLFYGDCLKVMKKMESNSIDSIVTDPPAGIGFMNKKWDSDKGGRNLWISWFTEVSREMLRLLKPGGFALIWALPRTSHWPATALEDAGFIIQDTISHIFGQGYPKGLNISKAIDNKLGIKSKVVSENPGQIGRKKNASVIGGSGGDYGKSEDLRESLITEPESEPAKQWNGWNIALKPAREDWILCRKPRNGTVVENILEYGTGGLNIDACRVHSSDSQGMEYTKKRFNPGHIQGETGQRHSDIDYSYKTKDGRWPTNVALSHHMECEYIGTKKVKGEKHREGYTVQKKVNFSGSGGETSLGMHDRTDENGLETVEDWHCHEDCPIKIMDDQSGTLKSGSTLKRHTSNRSIGWSGGSSEDRIKNDFHASEGGASRFFYCGKPSVKERGKGNNHPTVKSKNLMKYLIKLITPPSGLILDCFMGSGTTPLSAIELGFPCIAIDDDIESINILLNERHEIHQLRF